MVERIYGRDGIHETCYLTRVKLTPCIPGLGQLYLHIFHRGDADPDPHDHPWAFWTLPLTSYVEQAFDHKLRPYPNVVRALRLHHRPATYVHRVLGRLARPVVHPIPSQDVYWEERGRIFTLVWHCPKARRWGFWIEDPRRAEERRRWMEQDQAPKEMIDQYVRGDRYWMHWREYVYGRADAGR